MLRVTEAVVEHRSVMVSRQEKILLGWHWANTMSFSTDQYGTEPG